MDVTGKLHTVEDIQQISNTFQKREFVLEYVENPSFKPEYLKFELIQDRCSLLDGFSVGEDVKVSFNLKGRKWENPQGEIKYFNSLQAWRLDKASSSAEEPGINQDPGDMPEPPEWMKDSDDDNGDLPF